MGDTDIIAWIAEHVTEIRDVGHMKICWLDEYGYEHETTGETLRDAVIKANKELEQL